jgi:hypothetical protein
MADAPVVMVMPEYDCSKHIKKVIVTLDESKLEKKQHPNLIAALLRQIADYTDGWCSTEFAKDANLESKSGMIFYFTRDDKRTKFIDRIGFYFRKDIEAALSAKKAYRRSPKSGCSPQANNRGDDGSLKQYRW